MSVKIDDLLTALAVRKRLPKKKGDLTRYEGFVVTQEALPLTKRNLDDITHTHDACQKQRAEFETLHSKLRQLMTTEKATGAEFDKEEKDYDEQSDRYEDVINHLGVMKKYSTDYEDFRSRAATCNNILDDTEGLDPTDKGVEEDMSLVREHLVKMGLTFGRMPTGLHDGLLDVMPQIKTRWRAVRTPVAPPAPRPVVSRGPTDHSHCAPTRLPSLAIPKFHGDVLAWPLFWEGFTSLLDKDKRLSEYDRLGYLRTAICTPEIDRVLNGCTGKDGDFDKATERLRALYDDQRHIYRTQLKTLLDAKPVDKAGALEYLRLVENCVEVLEKSGQADFYSLMSSLVEMKMVGKLREEWIKEESCKDKVPPMRKLLRFMEVIGGQQQDIERHKARSARTTHSPPPAKPKKSQVHYANTAPPASTHEHRQQRSHSPPSSEYPPRPKCKLCGKGRHPIYFCYQFKSMALQQKKDNLNRLKICTNCLGEDHTSQQCTSGRSCKKCGLKHNTCLHDYSQTTTTTTSAAPPSAPISTTLTTLVQFASGSEDESEDGSRPTTDLEEEDQTLTQLTTGSETDAATHDFLPTVQVNIQANGKTLQVRALLDTGSTKSFVTNRIIQKLQAVTRASPLQTTGLGSYTGISSQRATTLSVSTNSSHPSFEIAAQVIPTISDQMPSTSLAAVRALPFLDGLPLADPSFHIPGRVDLLIGLEGTADMVVDGARRRSSENGQNHAVETIYGWVVSGWERTRDKQASVFTVSTKLSSDINRFWEMEDCPSHDKALSRDDQIAVDHFAQTTSRDFQGRYVVSLPKKIPTPTLGRSRQQAMRRFDQNYRSLLKKGQWQPFGSVVEEYMVLGHAELVPETDLDKPYEQCYYLPMHGVLKASSTTTKLRVVFDGSAITSNGLSLNDTLVAGPNQYPLLPDIIIKFRSHLIGMTSDISKMFREIGLAIEDRDLHRFLWKDDNGQIRDHRMTRVTFGITTSPFLATQTIRQMADDYDSMYPDAANIVRTQFYVDDCITGADTVLEAITLRTNLNSLLQKGCMSLRKWRSNSEQLQDTIPDDLCETEVDNTTQSPGMCLKTLGIPWDTSADDMYISVPSIPTDILPTKRQVSSDLARTYDVVGWFSPALVIAKLLIQKLWSQGLGWDDTVSDEVAETWRQWTDELPYLGNHPIHRCYFTAGKTKLYTQLHGFSDASQMAYGAVIYLRTFYTDTSTTVSLVTSKTKVAPLKTLTVPKLELCGAVILSQLLEQTQKILNISTDQTYAWTDSTIVLGWLNQPPGKLKVYVSNRVVAITKRVPAEKWHYVPTDSNPADVASRGMMPKELVSHVLWWDGPEWLEADPSLWPKHPSQNIVSLPEIRQSITLFTVPQYRGLELTERYSSVLTLQRTTAWVMRFAHNAKPSNRLTRNTLPHLTVVELHDAEIFLIKCAQEAEYASEIAHLLKGHSVPGKSRLIHLNPIIDGEGVLRVGGRLEKAELTYEEKHPAILPRRCRLFWLIIRHIHEINNHAGASIVLGLVSSRFSVSGARISVRTLTRSCVTCRKVHQQNAQQIMGQLPIYRTISSKAFTHVGVDFAGPVIIKEGYVRKPRKVKAFICLFVCMTTKAVHIEVVSSLSTAAFLAALKRFTSTRGLPTHMYSDNGTNFIGAARELKEAYQVLRDKDSADDVQRHLSNQLITWHHTPGRAPHFGGIWEANVKSVKTLLKKTTDQALLNYEELSTVLKQVEATLNSRPLVPLNAITSDDNMVLTPGHFLVGKALLALPTKGADEPGSLRVRWNMCSRLQQSFWNEWSTAYLQSINRLNKWIRPHRDLRVDDIVFMKDQDLFMNVWPLAIVTKVHPGAEGKVRAVTVRTTKGEYQRPVVKLSLLLPEEEKTSLLPGRMDAPQVHI